MAWSARGVGILVGLAVTGAALAGQTVGVDGSDTRFPATITRKIGGVQVTLTVTGTALREKYWFNVYSMASYVAKGTKVKTPAQLAAADVPKVLDLVMERDVGGDDMADAFEEAIRRNYPKPQFKKELAAFKAYFTPKEARENNHITFVNVPRVGVVCEFSGHPSLTIKNPAFSKAVWDIYLGKENVGEDIKKNLVKLL